MAVSEKDVEANVATTHKIAKEVWSEGNVDLIDEHYTDDAVIHSGFEEYRGPEGYREWVGQNREAFPDMELNLTQVVASEDYVAAMYEWEGTHDGRLEVLGIDATGKRVGNAGMVLVRYDEGKVVEEWNFADTMNMLGQLNMLPEELESRT